MQYEAILESLLFVIGDEGLTIEEVKNILEVDKGIQDADSIWIDFNIRGNKIKYVLK